MGKDSKAILEKFNINLVDSLNINQSKDTDSFINWFNATNNKSQCCFIQFYASITYGILDTAIIFARPHTDTSNKNMRIIKDYPKSLLYKNQELWRKKNSDSCFDMAIGT